MARARVTTTSGRGWVALARGELARAEARDGGRTGARRSTRSTRSRPAAAAYARLRAAEAELRTRGLRADVADLLREAAAVADEPAPGRSPRPWRPLPPGLGSRPGARRAVAGRARAASPRRPGDPIPARAAMALGLSAREVEVLELVAAGMTNGEIAERLFITRKTAAVHVTHILDKLGVANRVGAAMIGARVGLTGGEPPDDPIQRPSTRVAGVSVAAASE